MHVHRIHHTLKYNQRRLICLDKTPDDYQPTHRTTTNQRSVHSMLSSSQTLMHGTQRCRPSAKPSLLSRFKLSPHCSLGVYSMRVVLSLGSSFDRISLSWIRGESACVYATAFENHGLQFADVWRQHFNYNRFRPVLLHRMNSMIGFSADWKMLSLQSTKSILHIFFQLF
jgi:hypothetical protein